jgi:branched-chain amino acid transport system permease protein
MLYYLFSESPRLGGSDGIYVDARPRLGLLDFSDRRIAYLAIWVLLLVVYALVVRVLRAPFGRVLVGLRINERRTRSLGYATGSYKLVAFVLAGGLAGLAGYLNAALFGFVNPAQFGWRESGFLLVTVLLGGEGTLYGPMLGALALTFLQHYGEQITAHWTALIGAFAIAVVLFLPQGIAGLLRGARG